jgi:hypothetical protein
LKTFSDYLEFVGDGFREESNNDTSEENNQEADDDVENGFLGFVFLLVIPLGNEEADTGDDNEHHRNEREEIENEIENAENDIADTLPIKCTRCSRDGRQGAKALCGCRKREKTGDGEPHTAGETLEHREIR